MYRGGSQLPTQSVSLNLVYWFFPLSGFFYVSKSDSEGKHIKAGDFNSKPLAEN